MIKSHAKDGIVKHTQQGDIGPVVLPKSSPRRRKGHVVDALGGVESGGGEASGHEDEQEESGVARTAEGGVCHFGGERRTALVETKYVSHFRTMT